jgi:hypothetical protein
VFTDPNNGSPNCRLIAVVAAAVVVVVFAADVVAVPRNLSRLHNYSTKWSLKVMYSYLGLFC